MLYQKCLVNVVIQGNIIRVDSDQVETDGEGIATRRNCFLYEIIVEKNCFTQAVGQNFPLTLLCIKLKNGQTYFKMLAGSHGKIFEA